MVPSTVTSLGDSGPGTLRDAIANATPGDTIDFAPKLHGTITLTTGELGITQSLNIVGPGANKLTISGNDDSRVFNVGVGVTASIEGLTVTRGLADKDANNFAASGGGILNRGILTLTNDVLSDNQAVGDPTKTPARAAIGSAVGGGIANLGTLTVTACQFIDNQVQGASGIPNITATSFQPGSGLGAGIFNPGVAHISENSAFVGNVARGGNGNIGGRFGGEGIGGAIANPGGTLDVIDTTFNDNQASGGNDNQSSILPGVALGGAISQGGRGNLTVTDSTFSHNQASGGNDNRVVNPEPIPLGGPSFAAGGAVGFVGGTGTFIDSTFDHNQALGGQGAASGDGGGGAGGSLFIEALVSPVDVTVSGGSSHHNHAIGGPGGSGGNGGAGLGGGFASLGSPSPSPLTAKLKVISATVDHNMARGADGGDGLGGGFYNGGSSALTLTGATVEYNLALGGGHDGLGQGIGGGVYADPHGTFIYDILTVIDKNHASTSNDDIGP
jgi:hypothetical protein